MFHFEHAIQRVGDAGLADILKHEIEQFDARYLPLQQGLTTGGYALTDTFTAMILQVTTEQEDRLHVKAGIFYQGVVAGCSCADDPSPTDVTTEYCEVVFEIDRQTGVANVTLVEG